ncbi:hypothetical protein [Dokdonella sp.]|uniref:hypothetical protein n=1 Tax=Dokdonella sp. TaxID=2291710 RepID=UPI0025C00C71|nr:hypothetical protein [Dokdonella sp.]MBX3693431.1 hypothetical protein [Dokdonella sp.]MCW5567059.1 hypothetical protein [Dokdonella sp.]
MRCILGLVVVLVGLSASAALPFDGEVDSSFGNGGQVALTRPSDQGGHGSRPTGDLAMLPDGRFLWAAPMDDGSVWVGRMLANGSPDALGGHGDGRITVPACGDSRNVMLLDDGAEGAIVWASNCLVHVRGDGSVDTTFGAGNMPPHGFRAAGLARDSAGRFVLAGKEGAELAIYRFDAQGVLDPGFGIDGRVEVVVPTTNGTADLYALVLRPDRRILVGGSRGNVFGPSLIVAQYTEAGALDPSWSGDGIVDIAPRPGDDLLYATAMALDADGSLVVSGIGSSGDSNCCRMLMRLDSSGEVVPSFGIRLFMLSGMGSIFPFFEQRDGLALLPNRRIQIGAISFPIAAPFTHRTRFTLIRTFSDGSIDTAFGHNGWNSFTIVDPESAGQSDDYDQMHAMAYTGSGLVMLGRTFFEDNSTGNGYVTMVRAKLDLIFDHAFDD